MNETKEQTKKLSEITPGLFLAVFIFYTFAMGILISINFKDKSSLALVLQFNRYIAFSSAIMISIALHYLKKYLKKLGQPHMLDDFEYPLWFYRLYRACLFGHGLILGSAFWMLVMLA